MIDLYFARAVDLARAADQEIREGRMWKRLALHDIIDAMDQFGGSFVRALAQCIRLADEINRRRLVAAFPEYLDQYEELAIAQLRRSHQVTQPLVATGTEP